MIILWQVKKGNNAIFSKSIENPVNKVVLKIVTTRKQYLKRTFMPAFKREKQFCSEAIAIENQKCRMDINELIHIGANILDLSKVLMQDFH